MLHNVMSFNSYKQRQNVGTVTSKSIFFLIKAFVRKIELRVK